MNRLLKITGISLTFFILISCNNKILLQRVEAEDNVIVRMNKKYEKITVIQFPFTFCVGNKSITKKEFGRIIYEYGYNDKGANIMLFDKNREITNNQLKTIPAKKTKEFLIYSVHFTDSTQSTQQSLAIYVGKMLELNQDTLHIGTVAEFRQNHAELFKLLTENDTISIRYLKNKHSGLGERIAIPANW